jgi:membrane-bound serine protease (ClpP class)
MWISRTLAAAGLLAVASGVAPVLLASAPDGPQPVVYLAEVDGIIHPVSAEYLQGAIAQADSAGAALIVITLRTPGGLVDSTRDINTAILAAKTPVVVFVGPSGSRAASAGFLITMAADVAAMAPGTHIGAAHPVAGNGQQVDEVMAKKMASDVAGYARTIATQRKRNVDLVEKAVTESRTYTEHEALDARPPLIDLLAFDVPDLLRKLDGRTVNRFDGHTVTLHTANAVTRSVSMTWAQRTLSALAHPQIAYLLLMLGTLGLTVELWSPGAVLPGVAGGICLLLAFFAFQVLPVSAAGILLIMFGIVLLVLEVKVTSYGVLAVGGIVSLLLGSLMLVDSPLPELQVGLRLIVPVSIAVGGIVLFLVRLAVGAQRHRAVTGDAGMLDEVGRALTSFERGSVGQIQAHGEIWTARADVPIHAGDPVRVVAVKGLMLTVDPEPTTKASGSATLS